MPENTAPTDVEWKLLKDVWYMSCDELGVHHTIDDLRRPRPCTGTRMLRCHFADTAQRLGFPVKTIAGFCGCDRKAIYRDRTVYKFGTAKGRCGDT